MKIQCHRATLTSAFQIVNGIVPTRTPKEILRNVKLKVADSQVLLIATDQEVGIRYEVAGVEIESGGEVLLPSARVISILRELTDETVEISLSENVVVIKSGQSQFRLAVTDPAEFPTVVGFASESYYAIAGSVFREGVRRTIFSTDVESTRYALGGILLEFDKDRLVMAATDSRRLAVVESVCRSEGEMEVLNEQPVIPKKAMSLIEHSIPDDETEVQIAIEANAASVRCGSSTIYSRLVEGRFPKYRDVIPNDVQSTVDLVVGSFNAVIRQAQIVTDDESRGVDFHFSSGLLTMSSQSSSVGESKIELPISYDGEEMTVTFDPRFISEFLRTLDSERTIQLQLIDAESAAVLKTDDGYTYVIMPLSRDR